MLIGAKDSTYTTDYMNELLPAGPGIKPQEAKPELKKPRLYKVVLLNDDYTPMDFVVQVLQTYFEMQEELAVQIMLNVHQSGSGICGRFTREIAEMKVRDVLECARRHQHPLQCTMEPE